MTRSDHQAMAVIQDIRESLGLGDDDGGWQTLADYLEEQTGEPANRGLLWAVAKGQKRSRKVRRWLGMTKKQIRLCATLSEEERKLAREKVGERSWTEFVCALLWYDEMVEPIMGEILDEYKSHGWRLGEEP